MIRTGRDKETDFTSPEGMEAALVLASENRSVGVLASSLFFVFLLFLCACFLYTVHVFLYLSIF